MAAKTTDQLIDDTEELLYGIPTVKRPMEDTQVTDPLAIDGLEVEYTRNTVWKDGDYAEYVADGEIVILTENHPAAASTVTIRRAQRGTTAAAQATGEVVRRNPIFPREFLREMLAQTIDVHLWPDVYGREYRTLTYDTTDRMYPLAVADDDVLDMYQYNTGSVSDLKYFPLGWYDVVQISTDIEASGKAIMLRQVYDSTATVYYTAKQRPRSAALGATPTLDGMMEKYVPWKTAALALRARFAHLEFDRPRGKTSQNEIVRATAVFEQQFADAKNQDRRLIQSRNPPQRRYKPRRRRSWT